MTKAFDAWRVIAAEGLILLFIDEIDTVGARGSNSINESLWSPVINALMAFLTTRCRATASW